MDERRYADRYSWRMFLMHARAYYKDRYAILAALGRGLGGGASTQEVRGGSQARGPSARVGGLPAWFPRRARRRYSVTQTDGPIDDVRRYTGRGKRGVGHERGSSYQDAQAAAGAVGLPLDPTKMFGG